MGYFSERDAEVWESSEYPDTCEEIRSEKIKYEALDMKAYEQSVEAMSSLDMDELSAIFIKSENNKKSILCYYGRPLISTSMEELSRMKQIADTMAKELHFEVEIVKLEPKK